MDALAAGTWIIVLAVTTCLWMTEERRRKRVMPPGPTGLPVVGYIPFMPADYGQHLQQLRQQYGRMFTLTLGSADVVVLSDYEIMKQVMTQDAFNHRPEYSVMTFYIPNSLAMWNGSEWKEQRKFALRVFRHLGLGREETEQQMLDEIGHLLSRLRSESGKAVRVERLLGSSVSNVLCQYVTGKRYDYDHPVRTMLDDCLTPRGRGARPSLFGYLAFMPTLMHLLSLLTGGRSRSAFQKRMQRVQDHVRQRVRELEAQPLPDSPSCFIESYLKEMRDGTTFDHDHLMGCVFTFFIAGVNVMTDYVTWFLLFMTLNPDVQQRMREEVDHVVGRKTLSSKYRPLMPYTQAVMLELHRVANIAPSGLNHALAQDRQVAGYLLPKGTQILLSSFLVHTDPEYFPEPNVFRPERFLAPDGSFVHDERVVHFGIGKRSCPGEPIAQNQLFLYLTSVLQTFLISSPPHSHYCDTGVMDFGGRVPVSPVRIVFSPRD